jgi:hypothetical protein
MSQLVAGKIPAQTECPFLVECGMSERCHHQGKEHPVAFSCATARAYDMIKEAGSNLRVVVP